MSQVSAISERKIIPALMAELNQLCGLLLDPLSPTQTSGIENLTIIGSQS
jgi:hypothetical protein